MTNARLVLTACLASICLIGCSGQDDRVAISGNVNWQGSPLSKGSIVFVPADNHRGPKLGTTIADGKYQIAAERGATFGSYRVEIRGDIGEHPHSPTDRPPPGQTSKQHTKAKQKPQPIPPEYNEQTKLRIAVTETARQFDFDLPP